MDNSKSISSIFHIKDISPINIGRTSTDESDFNNITHILNFLIRHHKVKKIPWRYAFHCPDELTGVGTKEQLKNRRIYYGS